MKYYEIFGYIEILTGYNASRNFFRLFQHQQHNQNYDFIFLITHVSFRQPNLKGFFSWGHEISPKKET